MLDLYVCYSRIWVFDRETDRVCVCLPRPAVVSDDCYAPSLKSCQEKKVRKGHTDTLDTILCLNHWGLTSITSSLLSSPLPSVKRNGQAVNGNRQASANERPGSQLWAGPVGALLSWALPHCLPVEWERLWPSEGRRKEERQEATFVFSAVCQPEGRPTQQQAQHGDLPPGAHQFLWPQSCCTHPGINTHTDTLWL